MSRSLRTTSSGSESVSRNRKQVLSCGKTVLQTWDYQLWLQNFIMMSIFLETSTDYTPMLLQLHAIMKAPSFQKDVASTSWMLSTSNCC